ncbi:hypothetical protein Rhe02_35660 [Rhizocola hellebori]|uniref:Uncharacterized protein n=1 Tax=Rhizocola hellebori TaxID=1392758 RepID=A0A8J3VFM8_9ACTN|nr:hypothetical protein [Rhizocola hellebori]GIH05499.1 hypothetical protein Rhe02_35660 [Rhizocola hellebori]
MAVRFVSGGVLRVPLPGEEVAYAVMLATFPYVAFYGEDDGLVDHKPPSGRPLFVVAVQKNAYSGGGWGPVLFRLGERDLPQIPSFYRQNVMRADDCEIVEASGVTRKASPAECIGLERSAVWAAVHIERRIQDHYANRPNAFLESMRLKL